MQLSTITLFAALTSAALATPINRLNARDCDVAGCAIALGPAAVGCGAAAAQLGVDPISDIGCLAGALNSVVNVPEKCKPCAQQLGIDKAVSGAENAASSVVGNVKTALGGIF